MPESSLMAPAGLSQPHERSRISADRSALMRAANVVTRDRFMSPIRRVIGDAIAIRSGRKNLEHRAGFEPARTRVAAVRFQPDSATDAKFCPALQGWASLL